MNENNLLSVIIFAPLAGAAINWLVAAVCEMRSYWSCRLRSRRCFYTRCLYLAFKSGGALRSTEPIFDHLWTGFRVGRFVLTSVWQWTGSAAHMPYSLPSSVF